MKNRKTFMVAIVMVTVLVLFVGCSAHAEKAEVVSENEILSVKVESRPITNGMGGIAKYRNYVTYSYVSDDGTVEFEEHMLFDNYDEFTYEVIFHLSEENKVVVKQCGENTSYEIYLTRVNYEQIFTEQEEDVN